LSAAETSPGPHQQSVSRLDQGKNPLHFGLLRSHNMRTKTLPPCMCWSALIVQNGGLSIIVGEHGVLPDGLPQLARGALTQLRRKRLPHRPAGGRWGVGRTRPAHPRDRRVLADRPARTG
jgi:hypothetical protein